MGQQIKKGDLVMVVAPKSCGCVESIGQIRIVDDLDLTDAFGQCRVCAGVYLGQTAHLSGDAADLWIALPRLKKIDPPAEGELTGVSVRKREPVKA